MEKTIISAHTHKHFSGSNLLCMNGVQYMGNNALFSIFYPIFLAHVIHGSTLNTHKQMCKLTFLMLLKGNPYQRHSLTKPFSFVFKYFYFFHSLVGELFFFSFFFFCPLSGPKKRNFSVANEPTEKCIR